MKSTIIALAIVGVLAGLAAFASYTPPTPYVENTDRVFTNVGKVLELVATDDPNYLTYAKSRSRAYLKNGDTYRVLIEVNGTITEVCASGTAVCKETEVQPVYIKARVEQPCPKAPTDPALEITP